jgi:hypothetical protein
MRQLEGSKRDLLFETSVACIGIGFLPVDTVRVLKQRANLKTAITDT